MRFASTASRRPFFKSSTGKRAFVEKFLHQLVVAFGDQFHQRFVRCLRFFGQIGGNFLDFGFAVAIGRVDQRLHRDQINHAAETLSPSRWAVESAPRRGRNTCCSDSSARSKLASSRSIQFSTNARGRSYSVA